MKKLLVVAILAISSISHAQESYKVQIDLTKAQDDKVPVEVMVPAITADQVEYHMAKIVPGTYSISDFGRFVDGFKALDADGNELETEKTSTNRWTVKNASKLKKITYWVEDSFDEFEGYGSNKIFEPGGTGIDADRNVYVMNTFGFVGYIDGLKFNPYEVSIKHDQTVYGATSLKRASSDKTSDTFTAENFNFLADAPIMYSEPDTISKQIAGANILVSVYSPNAKLSAKDVMDNIDELMEAQAKYLGGKLPVDRYAYLIYLFDGPTISNAWGALEHSYSSLYTLPEMEPSRISQTVKDVAAHEFFHIVTPLNIHSEQIHDFNYIEPEMSQHLWLYEGVTEYSSHHVQVKYGLYDLEAFLNEMQNKMNSQERYNITVPYTEFSAGILEPANEVKYGDVYSGGALIAMCLDLTIIKSTDGQKDLQAVLREMSKKYGPFKAFKDEELFSELEKITNKEVGDFLRKHVGGTEPLPFMEVLGWAGINYTPERKKMVATTGKFSLGVNESQEVFIRDLSQVNEFGKNMGFEVGDVFVSWAGEDVTLETINSIFDKHYEAKDNSKIKVVVKREIDGEVKEVKLKAKAILVESSEKHVIEVDETPDADQTKIREAWLSAK
ncbi:MAG: peptidase M61 [Cyclobacteriaceae bacterium]